MRDFLAYCDGDHDLIDIAEAIGVPARDTVDLAERFLAADLIEAT